MLDQVEKYYSQMYSSDFVYEFIYPQNLNICGRVLASQEINTKFCVHTVNKTQLKEELYLIR